ncbi:MAG TPA: ATP phosphoribosyltransferase regulatory subunit [Polyangiaceae bacterium]|nr:ATP phosphoribosyltransferase regulatory subunit [Polyangiaceae bacterium]
MSSTGALASGASRNAPGALAHPVPAGMRDLLPEEAARHLQLGRKMLRAFELRGYELVSVPLFEFSDVVERGAGALEAHEVLRFVEPESGSVVSLRPDMTPQIARLVATRLAHVPGPVRLCYQGSVLRRRHERARRHRQIPQVGLELIGEGEPEGDLEVLSAAAGAVRATGLSDFVIDLGHAGVATALVEPLEPARAREILDALEVKDEREVARRAERYGLDSARRAALAELPLLHGGVEVFARAERALGATPAAPALQELKRLFEAALRAELAPSILVDLGETRDFEYYTGPLFQIHAEGPGSALGSGGRYDGLLARFGAARPAVGFALRLDDVAWALEAAGLAAQAPVRVLLIGQAGEQVSALHAQDLVAAQAPEHDALAYAKAFRFSHCLGRDGNGWLLQDVRSGNQSLFGLDEFPRLVAQLKALDTPPL